MNVSTKIIIALLVVIAIPAFYQTIGLVNKEANELNLKRKENYCRKNYPSYTKSGMSEREYLEYIDKRWGEDPVERSEEEEKVYINSLTEKEYNLYQSNKANRILFSTKEEMLASYNANAYLNDYTSGDGYYDAQSNRCYHGRVLVGPEL